MVSFVLQIYVVVIISVLVHEIFHVLVARLFRIDVYTITIGSRYLQFKFGILQFSPLAIGGYVEVNEEQLLSKGIIGNLIFYISGIIGNIMLILGALFITNYLIKYWIIIFNLCMIIVNILPLLKDNDGMMFIEYCKEYITNRK